jgi:chromosome partitioning protein
MKIGILSNKGGVGKSTIAVNLAGAVAELTAGRVLLVDGDDNRSALQWSRRGAGLPFCVCPESQAATHWPNVHHAIIDTAARPTAADIRDLLALVDWVAVVVSPDALSLATLRPTIDAITTAGGSGRYRVMLSMIPPVGRAGLEARALVEKAGWPILAGGLRRYAAHSRAAAAGCLVRDAGGEHAAAAWSDALQLAREILG